MRVSPIKLRGVEVPQPQRARTSGAEVAAEDSAAVAVAGRFLVGREELAARITGRAVSEVNVGAILGGVR